MWVRLSVVHICVVPSSAWCFPSCCSWCPSTFSGYHWPFLGSPGSLRPLTWDTCQYCFYTEMNCMSCWTLIYSCYGQGAELLLCPGLLLPRTAFFGLFSPSSALSWLLSAVSLSSHHKPAVPASFSLKQVQRSSNSQLWYNSYGCSWLYAPKTLQKLINHVCNNVKEKDTY